MNKVKHILLLNILFVVCAVFTISANEKSEFLQGVEAMSQHDYKAAILHFENDIEQAPSYEAYYNLGLSYFEIEDFAAALWAMEHAYYLKPSSKDAKHNATQILQNLKQNKTWEDPFSNWTKFTVRVGALFWLMLSILISVAAGLLFFMANTSKHLRAKKQFFTVLSIAVVLLLFTVLAGKHASNHFEHEHYVLPKKSEVTTFLSPNGLTLDEILMLGDRYQILERQDNWIKIEFEKEHPLWVHADDVFYY